MKIIATTRLCASLANPNKATKAPIMHNAGFDAVGANLRYVAFEPEDIGAAIRAIRDLDFAGVTVSQPFKQDVMAHLDEIDDIAQHIGAVNVVHNRGGRLIGYNSDWLGATGALEETTSLTGKTAAVLGAGGAARAVAFGLRKKGARVTVFNRSVDRGRALAKSLQVLWGGSFAQIAPNRFDVIVNTIPTNKKSRINHPWQGLSLLV